MFYPPDSTRRSLCLITENAVTHIITDISEPAAVASPIGKSVDSNIREVRYAPGMRTNIIAIILCKNDSPDFERAQK